MRNWLAKNARAARVHRAAPTQLAVGSVASSRRLLLSLPRFTRRSVAVRSSAALGRCASGIFHSAGRQLSRACRGILPDVDLGWTHAHGQQACGGLPAARTAHGSSMCSRQAKARAPGSYRMTGSELPRAVLQALEAKMAGEPRKLAGEAAAREQRWQP